MIENVHGQIISLRIVATPPPLWLNYGENSFVGIHCYQLT